MGRQRKNDNPKQATSFVLNPEIAPQIEKLRKLYTLTRLINAGLLALAEMDREQLEDLIVRAAPAEDPLSEIDRSVRGLADESRRKRPGDGRGRAASGG
jgi:hypothetical protein